MNDPQDALAEAEALIYRAKRAETQDLVEEAERSGDRTLQSLARAYRLLNFGPYR